MTKKVSKKTKRRIFLVSIVSITLITLILVNLILVWNEIGQKSKERKFYSSELKKLEEQEAYLKVEVEKLQDPDYVARYAREQYLYSKDGEFNIRIK